MRKIKSIIFAMLAVIGTAVAVSSCSNDDDPINNYTKYQKAVDSQVQALKKTTGNKKAILLVAFGSTWQCAFDAFDMTRNEYTKAFPGYDVYVSYSSAICINRAAAGEHAADGAQVRNYYAPNFWLHALGSAKYEEIVVQSLQVIPGEEFTRVVNYIKDFGNNHLGDLDNDYLKKLIENGNLKLGTPLLTDLEEDVPNVAKELDKVFKAQAADGIVAFMGHGNPDEYDTYSANIRYTQLEDALQALSPNYFVGTVDMPDNYKENVWERIKESEEATKNKKITFQALMSIAGDHAHNDMVGEGDEYWTPMEPESDENSWLEFFRNIGNYTQIEGQDNPKGLLELPGILKIWMNHTHNAVNSEGLTEYFHSMFPEE